MADTALGFPVGTPAWAQSVTAWINWWAGQLAISNIQPSQLTLLLVDEPRTTNQDNLIIQYANIINSVQPQITILEDPDWLSLAQATPAMLQVSDVLCCELELALNAGQSYFDALQALHNTGHRLWFYAAGGPLSDPYFLRLEQWLCWKYGADTTTLWSFVDARGSSWSEYATSAGSLTPYFLDPSSLTPGKQMEALREGVEDYEYLRMLRDRVAALQAKGLLSPALAYAQALLASAPNTIIPPIGTNYSSSASAALTDWRQPKDRSTADTVRLQILQSLTELSGL